MRHNLLYITFLLTIILSSCHSTKKTTTEQYLSQVENQWQDVSMPVKCKLVKPKNISVSGKATMIRDREIKISLRMLGFEVAGLYANEDSIYVYEKLNHTMIAEALSKIENQTGITLSDMQHILLGQQCRPHSKFDWHYTMSNETPSWPECLTVGVAGSEIICSYSAPLATPAGLISPTASIAVEFGKQALDASLEWSLESASWNSGLSTSFQIPKGYRRISAAQLIKALSGL